MALASNNGLNMKQSMDMNDETGVHQTPVAIQKSIPPKPPGKRIQTSTQELRQRKPVISKKFF